MRSKGKHQDKMTQTLHIFTFTLEIESLINNFFFQNFFDHDFLYIAYANNTTVKSCLKLLKKVP